MALHLKNSRPTVPNRHPNIISPIKRCYAPSPIRATSTRCCSAPAGPLILNGEVAHSISGPQLELVNSLDNFVEDVALPHLKPNIEAMWQPSDMLPEPASDTFLDEVRELREKAALLSDEYMVVLVGDCISEEALPTYMAMLHTLDGVRDETGASDTPWARWTRYWIAEEKRHGDLLNKYCYLSGRVNFKAVHLTTQNLIRAGMNPKTENNPYKGFIYTSFQERATKISHGATARLATGCGDPKLAKLCAHIAGDEARHEAAYSKIVRELFREDPSGAMLAFHDMMKKRIVMPAEFMDDCQHNKTQRRNLFDDYSAVASKLGVYSAKDYLDIFSHFRAYFGIDGLTGLSAEATRAQEETCLLLQRFRKVAERRANAAAKRGSVSVPFSWVYGREIVLPA